MASKVRMTSRKKYKKILNKIKKKQQIKEIIKNQQLIGLTNSNKSHKSKPLKSLTFYTKSIQQLMYQLVKALTPLHYNNIKD